MKLISRDNFPLTKGEISRSDKGGFLSGNS